MPRRLAAAVALALAVAFVAIPSAQPAVNRERAKPLYLKGWEYMRSEAYPDAAKLFQQAVEQDAEFEDAYYGLGLANIRMKKYGEAIAAYIKCRDLYRAASGRLLSDQQDLRRYRQDQLRQLDELIRQYEILGTGAQTDPKNVERMRELKEQRRQLQEYVQRGKNITLDQSVPAFVSLALGSAYFRTEQWAEAEREYKAAVAADGKSGEALNNLAVVYLQTGRPKEADGAVKSAEKAGFKVHPQLKQDIKAKLGS